MSTKPDFPTTSAVGFVVILLFVPETKALSLEELDAGMCTRLSVVQVLLR